MPCVFHILPEDFGVLFSERSMDENTILRTPVEMVDMLVYIVYTYMNMSAYVYPIN